MTNAGVKIGIAGWPFRQWPFKRTLEYVSGLGVSELDYWPDMAADRPLNDVRVAASHANVVLYCYNVSAHPRLGTEADPEQIRAPLRQAIEEAVRLEIPRVQFYGAASGEASGAKVLSRAIAVIEPVVELAEQAGVTLWFENDYDESGTDLHGTAINRTPESVDALLRHFDSKAFRATFDLCNFVIAGTEGYPSGYELLRPFIENVHVKDARRLTASAAVPGGRDDVITSDVHGGAFLPVPAGEGVCNLAGLLHRVSLDSFCGYVTLDALCRGEQAGRFFPNDFDYVRRHMAYEVPVSR